MIFIFPWILIGLLILGVQSAFAQESVRVRSGEHVGFSRLVLYYPESIPWSLMREDTGYVLQTENGAYSYESEDVFKFMPKTRLEDLRSSATQVNLDVSCDCHANAFEYRPGILVIDIKDGPPPADSKFEKRFAEAKPSGEPVLMLSEVRWKRPTTGPVISPGPQTSQTLPSLASLAVEQAFGDARAVPGESVGLAPVADLSNLRTALSQQLATAVSGGLLVSTDKEPSATATENVTTETDATVTAQTRRSGTVAPEAQLDLGFLPQGGSPTQSVASVCDPTDWYSLDVVEGESAPQALARARSGLLDDLEKPNNADVLKFARIHVGLGFGAEAENVLSVYPINTDEARTLRDMARLVDWPGRAAAPKLASQANCDTDAALWGLLAHGRQTPRRDVNEQAVLRALFSMPLPLRTHLAPAVSEKLREIGKEDAARAARETVLRAVEEPGPDMALEMSKSDATPDEEEADTIIPDLKAASARTSPSAPLATAELIRRLSASRTELDRKLLDEAGAQIHAHKGTPESAALFLRYVDALARVGAFEEGMNYLDQIAVSEHAASYDVSQALSSLLKTLAASANDGTFLMITGSRFDTALPADPSQSAVQAVSMRLAQLGFRDEAIAMLPPDDRAVRDDRNVVLAEAALAQDEPMEALARVANVANTDARRIRAQALSRLGAFGEAAAIYTSLDEPGVAADYLWLASDWYEVHELLEDPARREMARRLAVAEPEEQVLLSASLDGDSPGGPDPSAVVSTPSPVVEQAPTLQERLDLIDDSAALRTLVSEFAIGG